MPLSNNLVGLATVLTVTIVALFITSSIMSAYVSGNAHESQLSTPWEQYFSTKGLSCSFWAPAQGMRPYEAFCNDGCGYHLFVYAPAGNVVSDKAFECG